MSHDIQSVAHSDDDSQAISHSEKSPTPHVHSEACGSHCHSYGVEKAWRKDLRGVRSAPKIGRNDPCPCGSGKKYKKCCLR